MKQTILTTKQSQLLEKLIVQYGQIVTSEEIYKVEIIKFDIENYS